MTLFSDRPCRRPSVKAKRYAPRPKFPARAPRARARARQLQSHAATTVLGVFLALPLAIYAHARITARIAATRAPYAVRLALTVLAFVACVTAASLLCFEACRAPCRAWVGVGCLRA